MLGKKILPKGFNFNRKQGFSIPLKKIFQRDPIKSLVLDTLMSNNSIFNNKTIERLLKLNRQGYENTESIFGLLMLQLWINNYKIST